MSETEVEEMCSAHEAGAGVAELAERFGVHRSTVHSHLKRQGRAKPPRRRLDDAQLGDALAAHRNGESYASIARRYNVDPKTIRTWVNRWEHLRRPRSNTAG